jgi:hypothetical protein
MEEPLEAYLEAFEERQDAFENLLEATVDLTQLSQNALVILTDPHLLEALRYVAGPPISFDDLKIVANATSLSAKKLEADPELVQRLVDTVLLGLDRRRFPWIGEGRGRGKTRSGLRSSHRRPSSRRSALPQIGEVRARPSRKR